MNHLETIKEKKQDPILKKISKTVVRKSKK